MLPTVKLSGLISQIPASSDSLVLSRSRGVVKTLTITRNLLGDNVVGLSFGLDTSTHVLQIKEGDSYIALTDEIGVGRYSNINILFIDEGLICVELKEGSLYLKNSSGVVYGFDDGGTLIRSSDKVIWVPVSSLYEYVEDRVMGSFNTSKRETKDYVYNMVANMTITHQVNSPSQVKTSNCFTNTVYKVNSLYTAVACGEFDFVKYEKVVTPKLNIWQEMELSKPKDRDDLSMEELEALEAEEYAKYREEKDLDAAGELFEEDEDEYFDDDEDVYEGGEDYCGEDY